MIADSISFFDTSLNIYMFLLHDFCQANLLFASDHLEKTCEFPFQRVSINLLIHHFLISPTGLASQMVPMKVVVKQTAVTEGFPGGSFFWGGCS